jgi:hypothetical protein
MKLQLATRVITVPDEIYLDQLIHLDLEGLNHIQKADMTDPAQATKMLGWFLSFFKAIDIKERFTLGDFVALQKDGQLERWFQALFKDFQIPQ